MCQLPQTKPDNKSDNGYSNRLMDGTEDFL